MARTIAELDAYLDGFEKHIGLNKVEATENEHVINSYLEYSWDSLNATDAQGCAMMHYEVSSFLVKLQRVINRLEAKHNYSDDNQTKKEIRAKLDRLRFLNFPLKNLLKSLEMLHSSKELEKKEDLYEQKKLRNYEPSSG